MRKNFAKVCLLSMAVALLFAACAREDFKSTNGEGKVFTATIGQITRTAIADNETGAKVNWVAGDEITINGVTYVAAPDASDATKAVFTKKNEADADPEPVNGKYYAVYGCTFAAETATGTLQNYQEYSADGANAPMYAESENTVLDFNNICGLLEITLKGTATVSGIKVSSGNLATSGGFSIADGQTAQLSDKSVKYTVSLNCGDGVALSSTGTKFYVAIPAGEYEALTVKAVASDRTSWSIATANTAVVEASKLYRLEFAPEFADHSVATVNDVKYDTLEEALAAANEAKTATVTILDDCSSAKIEIAEGTDITLDLNGKTIASYLSVFGKLTINDGDNSTNEGTFNVSGTYNQPLYLRPGCELIINGGTINGAVDKSGEEVATIMAVGSDSDNKVNYVINGGVINGYSSYGAIKSKYAVGVINGGTITCSNTDETVTVKAMWTSTDSDVTVNGGTFDSGMYAFYFGASTSKLTINDAVVSANTGLLNLYAAGTVTINGGYYSAPDFVTGNKKTANVVTTGGYYADEPNFVSTGYAAKKLSSPVTKNDVTYNYTVAEFNGMVEIAGTVYEDMAEAIAAINAATSDITVKFLQNISLKDTAGVYVNNPSAKVTLDLNGKTVRASNAPNSSAVIVDGASTVVDFIDSVGGGVFDHAYGGTGYTLTVMAGTANIISANISNMTGTGYGRVAVRVLATDAPAYLNMTGGVVRGGRGIRVGGSETARAYLTISGGLVESRNTDTGSHYSAVTTETGYCTILINGGTLTSTSQSVVFSTKSNANVSITITKNEVTGTIPFIYCGGSCKYCVASGSTDYGDLTYNVKAWNFYTNNSSTSYCGKPSPVKTLLDTPITDEYGYEYTYHLTPKDSN